MIHLDAPIHKRSPKGRVKYCHLTATTEEELHAFARAAGIPKHWFERSRRGVPHYDLNPENRRKALVALRRDEDD